jgi:hypothetical protein
MPLPLGINKLDLQELSKIAKIMDRACDFHDFLSEVQSQIL